MVKMHFARDVQNAVQAELNWFPQLYLKPVNMEMYPPDNAIKEFQDLLYTRPFDEIHQEYKMTPDEMAKLCGKRWISSDHLMWVAGTINKEQSNTFCWVLNTVNDIECLVERRLQSHKPSSLVFFVSVALSTGKTCSTGQ
ncbi:uncharacterized protein LOC111345054 [Stylophora pistillata]|uniref:uncharacterized protein LOC111345054 n=1 Tax=Stylophora pistillata TaxID=50429 RepID=UPI000C0432AD|nr:uncharacterized protein LOC111345054 [Stylophora pistillata]